MFNLSFVLITLLLLGVVIVASNPSPYFASLGIVVVACVGCGLLVISGGSFLPLILVLIYLGGILVVFAYSSALASDRYPESWGNPEVMFNSLVYVVIVGGGFGVLAGGWVERGEGGVNQGNFCTITNLGEVIGVSYIFSLGAGILVIGAGALLLSLLVVLELTRGGEQGSLRAL